MNNVLFVSFCDREYLTKDSSNKIINTLGHGFLQLPEDPKVWKKALASIYPLTELSLLVCQHSYCNKHGLINTITHNLYSKEHSPEELQKMFSELKSLYPDRDYTDWDRILEHKLESYEPKSEEPKPAPLQNRHSKESTASFDTNGTDALELTTFIENCANQLKDEYPEESDASSTEKPHAEYKILWLDDEIKDDHGLYQLFSEKVHLLHATNVQEASEHLIKDAKQGRPEIMLVIADYFLKEEKDGVYVDQRVQGYDFLLEVSRSDHPARIIALSSMQRHLQSWIAESYGVKYKELPKQVLKINTKEGATYVFNEAIKLANESWMQVVTRPISSSWNEFAPIYGSLIKNPNYENEEKKIVEATEKWLIVYERDGVGPQNVDFKRVSFNKYHDDPKYKKTWKGIQDNFFSQFKKWVEFVETTEVQELEELSECSTKELKKLGALWVKSSAAKNKWITETWENELQLILDQIKKQRETNHTSHLGIQKRIISIDGNDEGFLQQVRSLFIQRRIILYLYLKKNLSSEQIAKSIGVKYGANEGGGMRNYLSGIALQSQELCLNMTWEETNWIDEKLKQDDIAFYQKRYRQALKEMQSEVDRFLSAKENLNPNPGNYSDSRIQFLNVNQVKELLKKITLLLENKKEESDYEDFRAFIGLLNSLKSITEDYIDIPDVLTLRTNINNLGRGETKENIFHTFKKFHEPWLFFGAKKKRWGADFVKENEKRKVLFLAACETDEVKIHENNYSPAFRGLLLDICRKCRAYYRKDNTEESDYVKQRNAIYQAIRIETTEEISKSSQVEFAEVAYKIGTEHSETELSDTGFDYTYDKRDLTPNEIGFLDAKFSEIINLEEVEGRLKIISDETKCNQIYRRYFGMETPEKNYLVAMNDFDSPVNHALDSQTDGVEWYHLREEAQNLDGIYIFVLHVGERDLFL